MQGATQRVRSRNSGTLVFGNSNPSYSESMTDWVVPEFKMKQNAGILLNHPMSKWKYFISSTMPQYVTVQIKAQRIVAPYDIFYQGYQTVVPKPSYWTSARTHPTWVNVAKGAISTAMVAKGVAFSSQQDIDLAVTEVSSRIGSGTSQIWVSLTESRKTIGMLCKAVRLLRIPIKDALRALKLTVSSLSTQQGRSAVLTKASELWMEGRYGWRPFVYDAMAHWDANVQAHNARQRLTQAKMVGNSEVVEPDVVWFGYSSIAPLAAHCAVDLRYQRFVKTGQTADFNAMITGPARVFGAYDIVGTAWELIPFSWVIDKFINLGNVAQALQAAMLVDERIGWTTKIELAHASNPRSVVTTAGPATLSPWTKWYLSDTGLATYPKGILDDYTYKERVVISSFIPVMGLEGKLDFLEYLDLIALFRVLTKRT